VKTLFAINQFFSLGSTRPEKDASAKLNTKGWLNPLRLRSKRTKQRELAIK
jgi:hypothetical protein